MTTADADDPEAAFVEAFVVATRRERSRFELGSERKRARFLSRLCHGYFDVLDEGFARPLDAHTPEDIGRVLRAAGAPETCHVISNYGEIDGRKMPLDDALAYAVSRGLATVVCCIPGRLAYFEAEVVRGPPPRYVLERRAR